MPRDLADVLHYFLPELEPDEAEGDGSVRAEAAEISAAADAASTAVGLTEAREPMPLGPSPIGQVPLDGRVDGRLDAPDEGSIEVPIHEPAREAVEGATCIPESPPTARLPLPLPILGLPIGDRDVVRAAIAWNLAIETARLGGTAVIVAPASDLGSPLWPEPGVGPLGSELVIVPALDLDALYRAAADLATRRAATTRRGGIVFVRIPTAWLDSPGPLSTPIDWLLLLSSSDRRDLAEAYRLAQAVLDTSPDADVGLTVHGVEAVAEARQAFEHLSGLASDALGRTLISYGLLVDDLHVYRAIAAQRPIGLAHPQAPATRALMDVARLLFEDARSRVLG